MRDLHVADAGDFGKFGLLRWLVGSSDPGRQLTLGVIWYYWKEQAFFYMDPPNPGGELAGLDSQLYEALESLAVPRTTMVESLENMELLPPYTVYFRDVVPSGQARAQWFQNALDAMRDCDVVFLDPDIGLKEDGGRQHAKFSEAASLWGNGHSLIIYQDVSHRNPEKRTQEICQEIRNNLRNVEPIPLYYSRGGSRVFFVIPNPANPEVEGLLRERVDTFMASEWANGGHFTRVDC